MHKVTCNNCHRVHFTVNIDHIKKWQNDWIDFWIKSDEETRNAYGCAKGPPSPARYFSCEVCSGTYKNFRDAKNGDCPIGCTLNAILHYNF